MSPDLLKDYALQLLNTPYIFGGTNLLTGTDCSGLVCELLKVAGALDEHADLSAQGLFDKYSQEGTWGVMKIGSLVFYGKDAKNVSHVTMLIDSATVIGANSGDHTTTSLDEAKKRGAFVKLRPMDWRKDRVAVIRPTFGWDYK